MPFWPPFLALAAGKRLVKNKMSCRIKFISLSFYHYIKPRIRALGQPLRKAAHASDWGDSLNQLRRGGKLNTMVMMVVEGVVLMFNGFLLLFLL
jgi:hypothetical protein